MSVGMNGIYAPNGGRHGPFKYGTGAAANYFIFTRDPTNAYEIQVEKSADPTSTAYTVVTSDTVADTGKTIRSIDVKQSGNDLYAIVGVDDGSVVRYSFYIFSMSSESFTATDENAMSAGTDIPPSSDVYGEIEVQSDGSCDIFFQTSGNKIHGTAYKQVGRKHRTAAGVWDTGTTVISDGGSVDYNNPRSEMDSADKFHMAYFDGTDIQQKSWNGTTLSSAEALNDNAPTDGKCQLAYINDGTSHLIVAVWERSSNGNLVGCVIDDDATPGAETNISGADIVSDGFRLSAENNADTTSRVRALWIDAGDSDIDFETYNPTSGWSGSVTSLHATITAVQIAGANVYTNDSGTKVLAWLADETASLNEYYEEKALSGDQTVTPSFISSVETVYQPTIIIDQTVTPNFIASAEVVYQPTVFVDQMVEPNFISSEEVVYQPQVNLTIKPDFIGSGEEVYQPQVNLTIKPDFIGSAESVYQPTIIIDQTLTPNFIASEEVVYQPQVNLTIKPDFIASEEVVYQPQVNLTIKPDFIASEEVVYQPTVNLTIKPDFITSGEVVYQPTVTVSGGTQTVEPGFIGSAEAVYQPTVFVDQTIEPNFIASGEVVYQPQINLSISPDFIASGESVYQPTIIIDQTVEPNFIASGEEVYQPQVNMSISPDFIGSGEEVYQPQVNLTILPDFVGSEETVYQPNVIGTQALIPDFIGSAEAVYQPTVFVGKTIEPNFIASGEVVYQPQVNLSISPDFISSGEVVYQPQVNLTIFPDLIGSEEVVYAPTLLGAIRPEYVGEMDDYVLFEGGIDDYALFEGAIAEFALFAGEMSDYALFVGVVSGYELFIGRLEDDVVAETGYLGKTAILSKGPDHTGSYTEPDSITFYVKYPGVALESYERTKTGGDTSDVSAGSTGVYRLHVAATKKGNALVQYQAVWNSPAWVYTSPIEQVEVEEFIGA